MQEIVTLRLTRSQALKLMLACSLEAIGDMARIKEVDVNDADDVRRVDGLRQSVNSWMDLRDEVERQLDAQGGRSEAV